MGWVLVVAGIVALVIPGPGLLLLVAGLAVLSQQYEWAERRLKPVKIKAFQTAAESVKTWPRIIGSCVGALLLAAIGVVWGLAPTAPNWWPLDDRFWLPGGWGTGSSLILSALVALVMIVYSYRRFRPSSDHVGRTAPAGHN
ncbi:MAG: PGPGW domain-containing protein [Gemmatimonadota bacterium]|nr:PGPGW domain-containing protein [Gemmatimonadota bacterium]